MAKLPVCPLNGVAAVAQNAAVKVYVPTASLPLGLKVPVQVMVSPLGAPQLAALKEPPLNPMPPNETSAAVGGVPAPVHDRSAVIPTDAVEP